MSQLILDWNSFELEMRLSNSVLHKQKVMESWKNNENIRNVLNFIYNPFTQYYLSKASVQKNVLIDYSKVNLLITDFYRLLQALSYREITGHEALYTTKNFIEKNPEYEQLLLKILNRDSELRVGATLINKVFGPIVPVFDVCLAEPYTEKKISLSTETWFSSHKLDGLRCLVISNHQGEVECLGRSGKPFLTFVRLIEEVKNLGLKNVVFDGEACIIDEYGNEDFQGIMTQPKKDFILENIRFKVFDLLTFDEFSQRQGTTLYSERYRNAQEFFTQYGFQMPHFELLTQTEIKDRVHFEELKEESIRNKWEGLIIRKDVPYQGKRSFNQMKVKLFKECECPIIGITSGPFRVIVDGENGEKIEKEEVMLSSVIVNFKGHRVDVGSGFSLSERREYYMDPEKIIEKQMTIQYQNESVDQTGSPSLRFPVKKYIWLEGRRDV